MHITRKNDQYFYFSDVPDVRSKRFWTDTTSSFGRWPKTLQLCPALVAFQKSTFETSATRLLSQPFSPRRCLATFFSARSPICVKLSRCTMILLKLQTSNWAHSCLEHAPFRGATKTNQPPRAPLVEEAVPKVCRKLTVPSCFFRSCKLPLKTLQSRLHIIRMSFQNVKPLCLRWLGLFIMHRMKRVKSFKRHSGFGVSTFFESHGPLIGWYAFKRNALNSLRFLSSATGSSNIFCTAVWYSASLSCRSSSTNKSYIVYSKSPLRSMRSFCVAMMHIFCQSLIGYSRSVDRRPMDRRHNKWLFSTAASLKIMFAVAACSQFLFCCPSSWLTFFDAATFQGVPVSGVDFFPPTSSREGLKNV